jgi:hypothetical protein
MLHTTWYRHQIEAISDVATQLNLPISCLQQEVQAMHLQVTLLQIPVQAVEELQVL